MKTNRYILSFHKWVLIWGTGMLLLGCEMNLREEPMQNIYKAKPVKAPAEKNVEIKKENLLPSIDRIAPPDSINKNGIKDTTETLKIEKKPEIKSFRRIYFYNFHKKPLIS